jgi:hypothetical protein
MPYRHTVPAKPHVFLYRIPKRLTAEMMLSASESEQSHLTTNLQMQVYSLAKINY